MIERSLACSSSFHDLRFTTTAYDLSFTSTIHPFRQKYTPHYYDTTHTDKETHGYKLDVLYGTLANIPTTVKPGVTRGIQG